MYVCTTYCADSHTFFLNYFEIQLIKFQFDIKKNYYVNVHTQSKLTIKLARWDLILHEYKFEVIHRLDVANSNADGCSRCPLPGTATNNHEIETLGEKTSCYYMQTSPTGHLPPSYFLGFSPRHTTAGRCQSRHLG